MTPYYDDGNGIVIYHGDCREILPQLPKVDLCLTDPQYGIGESSKKQKSRQGHGLAKQRNYGEYNWDNQPPPDWMFGLIIEKSTHQIIWGGNYFPLPPSSCWLVWDKDNGATDFADCELAWTNLPKAVRKFKWKWQGMLQEDMANKEPRFHPTQKPLPLFKWCLSLVPEIRLVGDWYMGSGTTLRAAKDAGINAIGIDAEEKYCEIAAKRLCQEVLRFPQESEEVKGV